MSSPRFMQIHFLTSYPAALLNRDDVGFAKRLPFGGVVRTRISSQCLKRHWRTFKGDYSLESLERTQMSIRSRKTFEKFVYEPLVDRGVEPKLAEQATSGLMRVLLGESAKAKKEKTASDDTVSLETGQITVLGRPELEYIVEEALAVCANADPGTVADALKKHFTKEKKKNLKALRQGAGLDAALFGRMVTSDILARGDAAVHVAHAFTVHAEAVESDYFSAVDDLLASGNDADLGSGHIGTSELTSGLFYGYVVVDVPLLLENLGNEVPLAAEIGERLVHLVSRVSPGAKLGSTAPHAYASVVLVESGSAQPRTFANAFLKPVKELPDVLANATDALGVHVRDMDATYGGIPRRFASVGECPALTELAERESSLADFAKWAAGQIRGGA
jgi:CRISPR system Cascade subunit CasC